MFRVLTKLNRNNNAINVCYCRFHSCEPSVKLRKPTPVYWSINGSNSAYTSVNATLHVSPIKVAFNCGEGILRIIGQKPLNSLRHICITRLDWRCVSGIPSILFEMHTQGARHLNVFGPSALNIICDPMTGSMKYRREFDVTVVDCNNGHTCTDNSLHIQAIPLKNPSDKIANVIAYVGSVEAHQTRFKIERCVDLNVPAGSLITQLANGLDVTLNDGSVVRAADVSDYLPKLNFLGKIKLEKELQRIILNCIYIFWQLWIFLQTTICIISKNQN